jgi:hypothetical protein
MDVNNIKEDFELYMASIYQNWDRRYNETIDCYVNTDTDLEYSAFKAGYNFAMADKKDGE